MNPKAVGERTEGIVLGKLMELGRVVLLPFGNNQRYDLVVDDPERGFIRGQCKTGRLRAGSVIFDSCSQNAFTLKRRSYHGQVEVFWVYCPETRKVYEVPVTEAGKREVYLRVDRPNRVVKRMRIRWAKDFEL